MDFSDALLGILKRFSGAARKTNGISWAGKVQPQHFCLPSKGEIQLVPAQGVSRELGQG